MRRFASALDLAQPIVDTYGAARCDEILGYPYEWITHPCEVGKLKSELGIKEPHKE